MTTTSSNDLDNDLKILHELNELRDRAKSLRESGRNALKDIESIRLRTVHPPLNSEHNWISTGNRIEAALLVKVQSHQNLSDDDRENDGAEAKKDLKVMLSEFSLANLFLTLEDEKDVRNPTEILDARIPVLLAARTMQILVSRSETVFSKETLFCYYRILRELSVPFAPDWAIGAARAGEGSNISAFVTEACISAILALEHAVKRTVDFCKHTIELHERYHTLDRMLMLAGVQPPADHPLKSWADKAIERMWFDWHISTNSRLGEIAFYHGKKDGPNELFPTLNEEKDWNMSSCKKYLDRLKKNLPKSIKRAIESIDAANKEIKTFITDEEKREAKKRDEGSKHRDRGMGRDLGAEIIGTALTEADKISAYFSRRGLDFGKKLVKLRNNFKEIALGIHRVLEPSKVYVKAVLDRELADHDAKGGQFDAGELVFAASSFGAMTDWKLSTDRLKRVCALVIENLPENGMLFTRKPIHSTDRGYKLLPLGTEIKRRFAQLLERTAYEIEPEAVRKLLTIVEEKLIDLPDRDDKRIRCAWNFDGATEFRKPSVWSPLPRCWPLTES